MAESEEDNFSAFAVRPFLRARGHGDAVGTVEQPAEAETEAAAVRGYLITGGRSVGAVALDFETMLKSTAAGRERCEREPFERGSILRWCADEYLSLAELSAKLRLPIGVARVVAGDLLAEGLIDRTAPVEDMALDTNLIARLIAGVRAL